MRNLALIPWMIGFAILISPSPSRGDHQVCDGPKMLVETSQSGVFTRNNTDYPFKTTSNWRHLTKHVDNICLEYSVHNRGAAAIQAFRWPDAGVHFVDLSSNQKLEFTRTALTRYPKAEIAKTKIAAFERTESTTQAFFTTEYVNHHLIQDKRTDRLPRPFGVDNLTIAAAQVLKAAGLARQPIMAYAPPSEKATFPELYSRITLTDTDIMAISSGEFKDGTYGTKIQIIMKSMPKGARLHAPLLFALKEYGWSGAMNETTLAALAGQIRKTRPIEFNDAIAQANLSFAATSDLYVMKHVVAVRVGERKLCVAIYSYGPAPISMDETYCEEQR